MDLFAAKESSEAGTPTRETFQTDLSYKLDAQADSGASIRSERSGSTLLDGDDANEQISKIQQELRDSDVAYLCLSRAYTQKTQAMQEEYEAQIKELRQENDQLKLKSPKIVQTLRRAVTEAKSQTKVAEQELAAAHERREQLEAENEALSKKHQAAQRSASEYSDLVKQFQSMLAECQAESDHKIRELMAAAPTMSSSKACSKCKFKRHAEAGHAQHTAQKLKTLLRDLQTACNEAKTRVQAMETTCMHLKETAERAEKRADYWMNKSLETPTAAAVPIADAYDDAPVSPKTVPRSPASDRGLRERASVQSIVTRPDCQFESLEETLKASKFWLRPLNRISSTLGKRPGRTGSLKGLRSSARSTPNLKVMMSISGDQTVSAPATPQNAVFAHGLATPGSSPSTPSFAKFPAFDC